MRWLLATLLVVTLATTQASELLVSDPQVGEASAIALVFMSRLKPQLQAALESGPPAEAIAVCAEKAPAIAAELSAETGWSVKRVSLRPRNPSALPDTWERAQLEAFDTVVAAGGRPAWVAAEVDDQVRFLAPQRVGGVCLVCHGESIDPATAAALKKRYPDDQALGYRPGEVRGAISISAPRTQPAN
jgi:hypothetical protein